MRLSRVSALLLAAALCNWGAGCDSQPQVSRANRRFVESLATAVSARNRDWVRENAMLIEEARAAAKLSTEEDRVFKEIIGKADAGDWSGAEALAFALRDVQRASAEDIAIASKPKLRKPSLHPASAKKQTRRSSSPSSPKDPRPR